MSKTEIEVNAVEVLYEDFYKALRNELIRPAKDKITIAFDCWKYENIVQLKDALHDAYCILERAYELARDLDGIDQMVNKKEETEEYREI
ncbi:MAG: hypothetical protein J6Y02_02160 [Pseudobutyrivibrio sp.]|nr:hypothetical protein [Pseudobutyrivibrio sp.]